MKTNLVLLLVTLAGIVVARADDEKFPRLKAGADTYTNVTVTRVTASDISFIHAGGIANVKLKDLPPELQKQFHYDPKLAQAAERKVAENKAKYHEQLLRQPDSKAPDMSRQPQPQPQGAPTPNTQTVWHTDYPGALKQAKAEGKLVLLDFTGSDWCGWCVKFERDVLITQKFADYAGRRLQLVRLDFPRNSPQSVELKRANEALSQQFKVDGFPTFVLVNSDGRELGRQVGYLEGGPDAFIAELEEFSRR
jgi:protein disulfide-isomerase